MQTATRPVVGGYAPVYSFTYNAIGLPTQTVVVRLFWASPAAPS